MAMREVRVSVLIISLAKIDFMRPFAFGSERIQNDKTKY